MVHRLLAVAIGAYPSYPALLNVQNVQVCWSLFSVGIPSAFGFGIPISKARAALESVQIMRNNP